MSRLMQWHEDAHVREMSKDGRKADGDCRRTTVTFLAGSGVTDASGQWQMAVADVVCEQVGLVGAVSFVATTRFHPFIDGAAAEAESAEAIQPPTTITVAHTASGGYVTLFARTWTCRCEPQPNVPFDYHVAIAYDFVG